MDSIANKFGMNVSQLRNVNGLPAAKKMRNSQTMLVPASYSGKPISDASEIQSDSINASEFANNDVMGETDKNEPKATSRVTHKVKKGETLIALANKYDTSTQALMKLNRLKSSKVKTGQNLKIKDGSNTMAGYKSRKIASKNSYKKVSSHKRTIKSKRKSSGHIHVRSHIRLK
jgi:membrane-bound lytic murein transglycosylase D